MNRIVYLIYLALTAYSWLIVARALISWFHPRPGGGLSRIDAALRSLTEPYLGLFRRLLPGSWTGARGIDLTPVVGLLALLVVMQIIVSL